MARTTDELQDFIDVVLKAFNDARKERYREAVGGVGVLIFFRDWRVAIIYV